MCPNNELEREVDTNSPLAEVRIAAVSACHRIHKLIRIGVVEVEHVLTRHVDTDVVDTKFLVEA